MFKHPKLLSNISLNLFILALIPFFILSVSARAQAPKEYLQIEIPEETGTGYLTTTSQEAMPDRLWSDPEETTGFGLTPDIRVVNPETRELTPRAQRAKELTYEEQRADEFWLLDEAIRAFNITYDLSTTLTIRFSTKSDNNLSPNFRPHKLSGLFDNIPAEFHPALARTSSEVEARARRARIAQIMDDTDKLTYSGYSGIAASAVAKLF